MPGQQVLNGSVALVTGAGRGLGQAVAVALARAGAHVVATSRTQGGLEETDDAIRAIGGVATLLTQDLLQAEAIDAFGPTLFQRFGRLDVLVHCAAALGKLTPASHIQMKDWDEALGVSVGASLRLIRTCAPLLQRADAGRAVFVTDRIAGEPHAYWGAYGTGKAAMAHLVRSWAAELRETRLRVNLFDPGVMATRLRRSAFPGENPNGLQTPEAAADRLLPLCLPGETRHGETVRN